MTLTPETALELLNKILDQVVETEEAVEYGRALHALSQVDEALANRVSNALSAFSLEHNKLIAIAFYKAGQSAGAALVRQQQGRRRSGPGHNAPRLQ